ncbi:MAG: hypothetical protein KOO60_12255, partial [Gemmatimonadales bacterium]|nr:hypothetical protein [Gemmatimonadales bacterium]
MTEFFPGKPACEAHTALKTAINTMEKARQNAVLWFGEILERKLYRELGYASIHQYAQQELGFSPARTSDFLSICRKLKNLPKLEDNLKTGKLGYTQARVLVKVADQQNETQWLDFAQKNSRRELELEVKRAKKRAVDLVTGSEVIASFFLRRSSGCGSGDGSSGDVAHPICPVRGDLGEDPQRWWKVVGRQGRSHAGDDGI